jgi:ribosomal protein L16 Arg81 hydroxylase
MQPYIICEGDYLAKLAHQFGFDADTVWNDPKNAQLQQVRPNPNILLPGDVLYIPDQTVAKPQQSVTTGTTNTFVTDTPTVTITVQFTDTSLASQAYSVRVLLFLSARGRRMCVC